MKKPIVILAGAAVAAVAAASYILISGSGDPAVNGPTSTAPGKTAAGGSGDSFYGSIKPSGPADSAAPGAADRALGFQRRQTIEQQGYDAGVDLDKALGILAGITVPSERAAFLRGLFERLAATDRKTAMQALKKLKDGDRMTASTVLVDLWTPEARNRMGRDGRMEGFLGFMMMEKDPMLAAEWAKEVLEGDNSKDLLNRAAGEIAKQNPLAALELGKDITDEKEKADFFRRVVSGWAQTKPDEAIKWAKEQGDAALLASAVRGMAESNPVEAAKHLSSIPEGDDRNRAIDRIVGSMAGKDLAAAEAMVAGFTNEKERAAAQRSLDDAAPVGIGASLRPSRDGGGFTVQAVPENSPAAKAGGLKANDRIVGILDPKTGQFVSLTNGGDMRAGFGLLRGGEKGSIATVQVISEGEAQTRVAEIPKDRVVQQEGGRDGGRPGGGGPPGGFGGGGRGR